jgi:hypothetical protein
MAKLLSEDAQQIVISNVPLPILEAIRELAQDEGRPLSNFLRIQLERIVAEYKAREELARR